MSFLYPLLWAGAAAVAVPLWLHLRAKTGPLVRFATLRFLEDQPAPRTRGFRLRDLALLALRAAAVILIVAAFAWPYRPDGARRVVRSRVHVLDATASRHAGDGFARDRERIRRVLAEPGGERQDAVVVLDGRPRVLVGFGDDRGEGARRVAAAEPSQARGSFLEALRLAHSQLATALAEDRRILVYSDQQENQWTENETSPPFLDGVTVEIASPREAEVRPNVSVADPSVRRFFVGDEAWIDLSAELRHERSDRAVPVRLEANGRKVLDETVPLSGDAGRLALRAKWRSNPGEWVRGELVVTAGGGALAADDRVFFTLPPVKEGRLAVLARSPYLLAGLSPEVMKGRWAMRRIDPSDAGLAEGPESALPEVLVLEGDFAHSAAVRALAFRCLNNGRGVILFLSRTTPLVRAFLDELGIDVVEPRGRQPEVFRFVALDHPLFQPFRSGELGDIGEARVLSHVGLQPRRGVPLAFGDSGDVLVLEGTGSPGRLLVFAFGMDRAQTSWPVQPTFLPFLDLALQHARSATPLQTSAVPGEVVVHEVPSDRAVKTVRVDGRPVEVDAARRARLTAPSRPGIYAITYDDAPAPEALLAVNPPAAESVLRYVDTPAALAQWTLPPRPQDPAPAVAAASRLGALDQRWWWWLLAGGALALALETLLTLRRRMVAA